MPFAVKAYLAELRRHFVRVVLLTNDDKSVPSADRDWLASAGIELWLVTNEGLDFGMWTKAAATLAPEDFGELCLANDSCLLLAPLDDVLAAARQAPAEVYGLTESHERGHSHLQSYFLLCRGEAVSVVLAFLRTLKVPVGGYFGIVDAGEIGLSRHLRTRGLGLGSHFRTHPRLLVNPTLCRAGTLARLGHPLLKRRLVRADLDPTLRRLVLARGECLGVTDCYRLLRRVGVEPARAEALLAADARDEVPGARRSVWWRAKLRLYVVLGVARDYVAEARAQPWPGVWRAREGCVE